MSFEQHWVALTAKYPLMFATPDHTIAQLFYRWGCVDTWNEVYDQLGRPDVAPLPPGPLLPEAP